MLLVTSIATFSARAEPRPSSALKFSRMRFIAHTRCRTFVIVMVSLTPTVAVAGLLVLPNRRTLDLYSDSSADGLLLDH